MRVNQGWLLGGLLLTLPAYALDFQYGDDLSFTLNNHLSAGVQLRTQDRDYALIGKENVPGQEHLCDADNCISLNRDPAPNQRLVASQGAYSGVNGDNGDLNYDKYDITAATFKLDSDLTAKWGEHWLARFRAIGYYDPVNANFNEHHFDTRFQPEYTKRPDDVARAFAKGVKLYDAYGQYSFDWNGNSAAVSVGNQLVRWGESTLVALNSLSEINPPNSAIFHMPGYEINEVFQPVPVALFSTDVVKNVSAEVLYQFGWKPVIADPAGSFMADEDVLGHSHAPLYITLGQFGEDPNRQLHFAPTLGYVAGGTVTSYLGDPREPQNGGQYGLRLNYFADWLNGGTETSFYYLNYHSRLPYLSAIATDDSCARDASNTAVALVDCRGFNGSINPTGLGLDPLPVQSLKVFLDYPENIHMFGFSFNTNIGEYSLAGEFAYRPNVPLQVQITDVVFAGLQPAFPANELTAPVIGSPITSLPGLPLNAQDIALLLESDFPSVQQASPSFLADYRHLGRIHAHQLIEGWQRMHVGQFDFTAIKATSTNPLGADQIIFIGEVGGTYIFNMPSLSQLQFEGGGPYRTSYSPGADGTGTPDGQPDARHLNPHQQTHGFADAFSWGIRSITRFEYNDVVFGWSFKPQIVFAWDISGIAPLPIQNFIEGRKVIEAGTDINITQALTARAVYEWYTGGGEDNTRKDRDNLALSLSYSF
ncbi:MAG TPA: DUF1302 family protein [Nevskiaceae bacterium]|nr:DUF1302 family protein [Nevskiaceae bacterium]